MTDTHAHLDHELFDPDRDEAIQRAFQNGIKKIITVGCDLQEMKEAIKLTEKYDNIYVAIGFHPENCDTDNCVDTAHHIDVVEHIEELEKLSKHPKVVAIGEIGLDYFRLENDDVKTNPPLSADFGVAKQQELFIVQLKLAQELNLPVIIHCRPASVCGLRRGKDAYEDLLEILKNNNNGKKLQGVIHCFCGTREHAKQFLGMGFYISFTGNITYFKKPDAELLQVVREIPLDRVLIETDCPFLSPTPHRGKRNEPSFVKYVAEKIAEIKGISVQEVENITDKNAEELFSMT